MSRLLCALAVLLSACSSSDASVEEAFCDLLQNGPEVDIIATDDPATAPEAFVDATKLEIALVDNGTDFTGYASFTPDEKGSFALGLGDDVPIALWDGTTEVPWEAMVTGAACPELVARYTAALERKTYTLEIGPTDLAEIEFVAEESDDDL